MSRETDRDRPAAGGPPAGAALVFFDFDDTLTRFDTTIPLAAFLAKRARAHSPLIRLVFAWGLVKVRLLSNDGLKLRFARLCLRGRSVEEVRQLARQFFRDHLGALVDAGVLARLRAHVDRGDRVYVVSANFTCLLEPLVDCWSLAGVIATEAEHRAGTYGGGVAGAACHRGEKLERVIARFGEAAVADAIAYGNRDDAPLLGAVRTGYLVRRARPSAPSARLRLWRRVISGQPVGADLAAPHLVEPFHAAGA